MTRRAPSVCVTSAQVTRLVTLIGALPAHGHVVLALRDGSTLAGVVHVRASIEVCRGPDGNEGMNAAVLLENQSAPGGVQRVWLDQVARVEYLDSALGGEN